MVKVAQRKLKRATLVGDRDLGFAATMTNAFVQRLPLPSFITARLTKSSDRMRRQLQEQQRRESALSVGEAVTPAGEPSKASAREHALMSSGLLHSAKLLAAHSPSQECFTIFLRVVTVLFLSVALHNSSQTSTGSTQVSGAWT